MRIGRALAPFVPNSFSGFHMSLSRLAAPVVLMLAAAPAWAFAGAPTPHVADFALFAAGVAGVLIGRRGARMRHRGK